LTAKTVASSLAQLLESMTLSDLTQPIQANFSANTFNICNNVFMPTQQYDKTSINEIFQTTLIRGLVNGNGDSPDLELKLAVSLEFRQHLLATVWLEARWCIEQ
jgi:hypothetical protein